MAGGKRSVVRAVAAAPEGALNAWSNLDDRPRSIVQLGKGTAAQLARSGVGLAVAKSVTASLKKRTTPSFQELAPLPHVTRAALAILRRKTLLPRDERLAILSVAPVEGRIMS